MTSKPHASATDAHCSFLAIEQLTDNHFGGVPNTDLSFLQIHQHDIRALLHPFQDDLMAV